MDETSPHYDPLHYVILFPRGEQGWHLNIPYDHVNGAGTRAPGKTVTVKEYYSYRIMERPAESNHLLEARALFQEYVVDACVKVESREMKWMIHNQGQIRADTYNNLQDAAADGGDVTAAALGQRIILPSTYQGSPRNMQQMYMDAMSIVTQHGGRSDLFITMTCNPNWKEIKDALRMNQHAKDRPDLTSRVFDMKLAELCKDLFKLHCLGKTCARFYVIEYQKRGLPHAHILLIFSEEDKPRTTEDYDRVGNYPCALNGRSADDHLPNLPYLTYLHRSFQRKSPKKKPTLNFFTPLPPV